MTTIKINPELEERFIKKCESLKVKADVIVNKLIEGFVEGRTLLDEEEFAEGLTMGEYLDLSESEKDALWARWEKVAEQQVGYPVKDVKPDALSPR
ncbi:MAG TPA: hypothetical protein EYP55_11910 [Anaerolineae bacterium]|nr:hypothetical protein [Anaerolineae bacterium]